MSLGSGSDSSIGVSTQFAGSFDPQKPLDMIRYRLNALPDCELEKLRALAKDEFEGDRQCMIAMLKGHGIVKIGERMRAEQILKVCFGSL